MHEEMFKISNHGNAHHNHSEIPSPFEKSTVRDKLVLVRTCTLFWIVLCQLDIQTGGKGRNLN